MIDAVSGSGMPMQPQRMEQSLTSEQLLVVEETLSKYDLENLTEEDAQAIVGAFEEADIQPGRALEEAMANAGADAREVGEMAGAEGPKGNRPPPPPPGGGMETGESAESVSVKSIVEYLEEMLQEKDLSELSEDDKQAFYAQVMDHFGLSYGESVINITA